MNIFPRKYYSQYFRYFLFNFIENKTRQFLLYKKKRNINTVIYYYSLALKEQAQNVYVDR